jgi:hypothetical protein
VSDGFCPLFSSSSGSSGNVVLLNGSSKGDAAAGGCTGDSVAATAGTCPAHYGFDIFTKSCTKCEDGWGGPACKQCSTDDACKVREGML